MTDEELVHGFETTALDEFPHAAHVRVAWYYLRRYPILAAIARFRAALQRFAASKGTPERYHETITVACMLIIAERLCGARDLSWEAFAARNPDLLQSSSSMLSQSYSDAELASPQARNTFTLPSVSL